MAPNCFVVLTCLHQFRFAFDTLTLTFVPLASLNVKCVMNFYILNPYSIRSILVTRMIFNLREVSLTSRSSLPHRQNNHSSMFSRLRTIDFTQNVFGNVGAPLAIDKYKGSSTDENTLHERAGYLKISIAFITSHRLLHLHARQP